MGRKRTTGDLVKPLKEPFERRLILDTAEEVFVHYNTAMEVVWASRAAMEAVGMSFEEIRGRRCYELWHGRKSACKDCPVIRAGESKRAERTDVATPDGRWWAIHAYPLLDGEEEITGFVVLGHDVTDRRKAEQLLREREARYRALFEMSAMPMLIIDSRTGRILDANGVAREYYGFSHNGLLGKTLGELAVDDSGIDEGLRDSLAKRGIFFEQHRHRVSNGRIRDVELQIGLLGVDEEGVLCVLVRDVTERRNTERAGDELFKQSNVLVCTAGFDGVFKRVNSAFESVLGYRQELLLGTPFVEFIHPEDRNDTLEVIAVLKKGGSVSGFKNRYRTTRGDYRVLIWSATSDSSREVIFATAVDATEQYALEEKLRQAQKMETVGQLASGIAHDFNNVLQAISGFNELAAAQLGPEHRSYLFLEKAASAVDRAQALVAQLLAFGRKQKLKRRPVELSEVVDGAVKMISRLIGEDIELHAELSAELDPVFADPVQLEHVLINLCLNARDAMPQGGDLWIRTRPGDRGSREFATFEVEDNGEGMTEEISEKIFDPFFTTKKVGKGTGLGLSTAYGIVRQHGGRIEVASAPGRGARFTVFLPVARGKTGSRETVLKR